MNPIAASRTRRTKSLALFAVALTALAVRVLPLMFGPWVNPAAGHQVDESFLPFEALAQWEGVTPREMGWPAATTRLALSAVYAVAMVAEDYRVLVGAESAPELMERIAGWSAATVDEPARLFLVGRALAVLIGLSAVLAVYWAAVRWLGSEVAWLAALVIAISPMAVAYSQFVLADMTGVLFAALALGLWARPLTGLKTAVVAGVWIGLAIASKHHFALWLLPAVVWTVSSPRVAKTRAVGSLLAAVVVTYLLLVPWPWLNPALFVKELVGVVGEKIVPTGGDFWPLGPLANLKNGILALGVLATCGLVAGGVFLARQRDRRWLPVSVTLGSGLLLLAATRVMHARYGLLLLPAVALVSAAALGPLLAAGHRARRRTGYAIVMALVLLTGVQLVASQREVGAEPPALQAGQWLERHAMPGQRIAVHSLFSYRLPRTRRQLQELVAQRQGEGAYLHKMASNGYRLSSTAQPFRSAVLCDEGYAAHWFLRELSVRDAGEGFEVVLYDASPRFNSMPEVDARRLFVAGLADSNVGFDYFLSTRPLDVPRGAAKVFASARSRPLYMYVR